MSDQLRLEDCVNSHCPWSGRPVDGQSLTRFEGLTVGFCNPGCRDKFDAAPDSYPEAKATFRAAALAQSRRAAGLPDWHIDQAAIAQALAATERPFVELFAQKGILAEVFAPEGEDRQKPHDRDELYMIISGTARFERDGESVQVAAGDLLYVPAFMPHRFHDLSPDFKTWVIFWGDPIRR